MWWCVFGSVLCHWNQRLLVFLFYLVYVYARTEKTNDVEWVARVYTEIMHSVSCTHVKIYGRQKAKLKLTVIHIAAKQQCQSQNETQRMKNRNAKRTTKNITPFQREWVPRTLHKNEPKCGLWRNRANEVVFILVRNTVKAFYLFVWACVEHVLSISIYFLSLSHSLFLCWYMDSMCILYVSLADRNHDLWSQQPKRLKLSAQDCCLSLRYQWRWGSPE